jgi:undecaprenyl-diphosphatase
VGEDWPIVYWTAIPMPSAPGSTDAVPTPDPGRLDRLDRELSRRVAVEWQHPRWFTLPLGALSLTANYGILWYAIALVPWLRGEPRPLAKALYVAAAVTLLEAGGFVLKRLVKRPRPTVADPDQPRQIPLPFSPSFPSSHASMAVAGVFTVGTIYPAAIPALIVLAAVLCFSRVYLGVHYLGDVLGGAALGLAGGILWVLLVPAPL